LFLKGTFEILANTRAGDPATIPDARHRCGSIFEAMSPIQPTALIKNSCFLLAPSVLRQLEEGKEKVVRHDPRFATG
jgi:hypothetical protein